MSDARGDDGDLEPVPFILMRAEETIDGQERVLSRAAYDLQCPGTVHSASCGHPGWVPDDYLEHLDGLGIETTITAAELCAIGTWQRVDGGYRVLDWESVEYALDGVRQRRGEDPKALAAEREHEAKVWAHMATPMVVTPPCAACGTPSARVELVPPDKYPQNGSSGPAACRPVSCGNASRNSGICCPGPYDKDSEVCRYTSSTDNKPKIDFALRLNDSTAGPWGTMLGAADLVRRSLTYIEDEVFPRFTHFFNS